MKHPETDPYQDDVVELDRLRRPRLDVTPAGGALILPVCGPPKLMLRLKDARHWPRSRGSGSRLSPVLVEADTKAGLRLRCRAYGLGEVHATPGVDEEVRLDAPDWLLVGSGRPARRIQVEVHGWPARESVRLVGEVGPYQIVFRGTDADCPEARGAISSWWITRLDGRPFGRRKAWLDARRLGYLARLGLNHPLSMPRIDAFDQHNVLAWARSGPTVIHPRAVSRDAILEYAYLGAVRRVPELMATAWDTWDGAVARYGVDLAVEYVSRATTTAYLDHEARDLVVALEAMVKHFKGGQAGDLRTLLGDFQAALGDVGDKSEQKAFVKWRNQLSHEGVVTTRSTPAAHRRLPQSIGWLRSYVLRHLLIAVGWTGTVVDFGSEPWRERKVRSARFCRPSYVPGREEAP